MRQRAVLVFFSSLALAAAAAGAEVRRLALVVGANQGRPERVTLRYAVTDAERFAAVMQRLGGVRPEDCVVLKDPSRRAFTDALEDVRRRASAARAAGQRPEVVLYFSGHADEQGLMLGSAAVSYREVRDAMQAMAADVGVTVLDACGSGVITRLKGGRPRPAFLTDESMRMQGQAFLTSSSENEAAQESEGLQGSFFTHALVSGLRGAADASGDGRVTLGEAYQFAFHETLAQTTSSQGGAQHPAYDIRMAGTGDLVMTDVRQASAALVLGPELEGRFFVRDGHRRLVAELYKAGGRKAELALEAGAYEVQVEQDRRLYRHEVTVTENQRHRLSREDLAELPRGATTVRGAQSPRAQNGIFPGSGPLRLELQGVAAGFGPTSGGRLSLGLLRSTGGPVALEAGMSALYFSDQPARETPGEWTVTDRSLALWVGARYYLPPLGRAVRPFLRLTAGPAAERRTTSVDGQPPRTYSDGAVLGFAGAGVDLRLGRRLSLGLHLGWHFSSQESAAFRLGLGLGVSTRARSTENREPRGVRAEP